MPFAPSLTAITALARSGAVERAWSLFDRGGWDARAADPAALAVKGRLLKDRALGAAGAPDRTLLLDAAQAYASAHALSPAPYLLINVATLQALAGNHAQAAATAGDVLQLLDDDPAETRYYIAATRAEASLLRGDHAGAEAALDEAVRTDPTGWLDRASTMRQLERICAAQGRDCAWLATYRPPASLHFVGHMGIAAGGASEAALIAATDELIASDRIGFGYGALAAGADIIIAERLVAAGCELHVILPLPVDDFAAQSVDAPGTNWRERFDRLLGAASTVQSVTRVPGAFEPLATALGGTLAMGRARLNAQVLASEAVQLAVLDENGGGANTVVQVRRWAAGGGQQRPIVIPRDDNSFARAESASSAHDRVLCALLHIALPAGEGDLSHRLAPLRAGGDLPHLFAMSDGAHWVIGFACAAEALAMAARLDGAGLALTAHYGIADQAIDPITRSTLATGYDVDLCRTLAGETPPGAFAASECFAAAMALDGASGWRAEPLGASDVTATERFALIA